MLSYRPEILQKGTYISTLLYNKTFCNVADGITERNWVIFYKNLYRHFKIILSQNDIFDLVS